MCLPSSGKKALISFKLICAFVFAYANLLFSHAAAHVLNYIQEFTIFLISTGSFHFTDFFFNFKCFSLSLHINNATDAY